jgi:hypothetical protein
MAVLVDQMELGECLRVELYEGGQVWVSKQSEVPGVRNLVELKLAAAPALKLLECLQLWEETLASERGVPHGSTDETVRGLLREGVEPTGGPDGLQASNEERLPEFFFIPSPQGLVPVIFWDYAWLGKHTSEGPDDSTA